MIPSGFFLVIFLLYFAGEVEDPGLSKALLVSILLGPACVIQGFSQLYPESEFLENLFLCYFGFFILVLGVLAVVGSVLLLSDSQSLTNILRVTLLLDLATGIIFFGASIILSVTLDLKRLPQFVSNLNSLRLFCLFSISLGVLGLLLIMVLLFNLGPDEGLSTDPVYLGVNGLGTAALLIFLPLRIMKQEQEDRQQAD